MPDACVLLTGATGLVGGDLLALLSKRMPAAGRIVVLTRGDPPSLAPDRRVVVVSGDLAQPDLGLAPEAYRELQCKLTAVLHCAAATRFSVPHEEAWRVNVEGTQGLVALASGAPQLQRFGLVSTAFVAGRRTGAITEQQLEHEAGFVNDYEWSKYEAERVVRASELPWSIYRLSAVVGDSRTGRVRQYNGIHHAMRVYCSGLLPVIPGAPDSLVDFIPDDFAADSICELFENFVPGATYHLCSGPERALPLGRLLEITLDAGNRGRHGSGLPDIRLPEMVDQAAFDAFRRSRGDSCGGRTHTAEAMGSFLPQLLYSKQFQRDVAERALADSRIAAPPMESYLSRVVDFCVANRWGRARC